MIIKHAVHRTSPKATREPFITSDGRKLNLKSRGGHVFRLTPEDAVRLVAEVPYVKATPLAASPPKKGPDTPVVRATVGAMEVEVRPGPDGELGTSDDEVTVKPVKKKKGKKK